MEIGFLPGVVQGVVYVVVGAAVAWILTKRGVRDALAQTAEGWRSLAEMRSQEIDALKRRIDSLESEYRDVREENEQLRNLNIRYQTEILGLRRRVQELELRSKCQRADCPVIAAAEKV
jgi:phage shock protein A